MSKGRPTLLSMVLLVDALGARFGGTAYAGVQIARALVAREDVERVVVVTRPDSIVDRGLRETAVERIVIEHRSPSHELVKRALWEAGRLRKTTRRRKVDGALILSGMLPVNLHCPFIGLQANPVPYQHRGVANLLRRAAVRQTSRWARHIYVPTRHVENLVDRVNGVKVVPLGVDHEVFAPAPVVGRGLVCVADFYVHKRHDLLLDAYELLPQPRPRLSLIGNPAVDLAHFQRIRGRAARIDGVIVEGRVEFGRLLQAYRGARVFLLASERESFSMPVVEALASGVPAVLTDHDALRETGGAGALYVEGDGASCWAAAIGSLIADDDLHADLRAAGTAHAQRYSWDQFAAQLVGDLS